MSDQRGLKLLVAFLILYGGSALAEINDGPNERRLSLPGGSTGLVLPKEDWVIDREQRRPDNGAVYYMLSSEKRQMIFSVFLERSTICDSPQACLKLALMNPQYKSALEMRHADEGKFRIAQFYLDRPKGTPVQQAHILASAYVDGIWYDVHISKTGDERPAMAPLLEVLRTVTIPAQPGR